MHYGEAMVFEYHLKVFLIDCLDGHGFRDYFKAVMDSTNSHQLPAYAPNLPIYWINVVE